MVLRSPTSRPAPPRWVVAALLAAGTALLYGQVGHHRFIHFDDNRYLTDNPVVRGGLTWSGIAWAFTTLDFANWHPLTWLSHMLDVQLFGLDAGAHHLVGAALHAANAALLFLALARMTGADGRSALVALLFAVHPLHVESVAWASERKDVLSTLFGLLALWAYARYSERPRFRRYAWVVACFALSLLAKPMWVTFPFLLLLLDVWPLQRFPGIAATSDDGPAARPAPSPGWLLVEKLPLLALSAASSAMTIVAQRRWGAVSGLQIGLGAQLANALVAYARYLGKTFWPDPLVAYYPYPAQGLPWWQPAGSALLLLAITAVAVRELRRLPFLAVGWFWFLGTLVPVIGLVQVGAQAMADRYTYLPVTGLFVSAAWGAHRLAARWPRLPQRVAAAVAVLILSAVTWRQIGYWSDHETLFRRAAEVEPASGFIRGTLAQGLRIDGKLDEALHEASEAVRLSPLDARERLNLALVQIDLRRFEEARAELEVAVRLKPSLLLAWSFLAEAEGTLGRIDSAAAALREVVRLAPRDPQGWNRLGVVYGMLGRTSEAVDAYRQAIRVQPAYGPAWANLALLYRSTGRMAEAGEALRQLEGVDAAQAADQRRRMGRR